MSDDGYYTRARTARPTIGEVEQLAARETFPAFVAARFAILLALIAMLEGAVAIALALR